MKTVNKYILTSCLFCYFAGIYLIAAKMGILRLVSRYGISRAIDEWPADFPSLNLVYICLAVYTVIFAIITYVIYRNIESHAQDMEVLQQKASTLHSHSEGLALVVSRYNSLCRERNTIDNALSQRLQLLEKQVSSLPTSALDNSDASGRIENIVSELDDAISSMEMTAGQDAPAATLQFVNLVERAIVEVKRLRTNSINIKST